MTTTMMVAIMLIILSWRRSEKMIRPSAEDALVVSLLWLLRGSVLAGLSADVASQVEKSREGVQRIKDHILGGPGRNQSYDRLAFITDEFGPRMSGSKSLEDALDYIVRTMREVDNLTVHEEDVEVPNWRSEKGEASFVSGSRNKSIRIAPLGSSVSGKVKAEVVVVRSFDELEKRKLEVPGKIVVFNQECLNYPTCVVYRTNGASRAAEHGALASLSRSATQYSIYSVHTGSMRYKEGVRRIPAASITSEDADFIQRFADRGIQFEIEVDIVTKQEADATSRNIVAEIQGSQFPEQVIIFGGHTDSWYLTDGAMDDGGGFIIAWEALRVIKQLGLKPRRTLRAVLWTSEENGLIGGKAYYERHKEESGNVSLIMESDHGVFKPRGLQFTGTNSARNMLKKILDSFLMDINTTEVAPNGKSSDTGWWIEERKVPGVELYSYNERYFDFHHTEGDTMSVLNPDHLDKATALWATVIYSVSNLDDLLPRTENSAAIGTDFGRSRQFGWHLMSLGVLAIAVYSGRLF